MLGRLKGGNTLESYDYEGYISNQHTVQIYMYVYVYIHALLTTEDLAIY